MIDPRNPPEYVYRVPAYYRSRVGRMEPRVEIGILRDPAAPIRIAPAVHVPPTRPPRRLWPAIVALAAFVLIALL